MVEAVRGLGEDLRGVALGPAAGALRPLVPELAPWLPAAPESLDDRRAERHRVFRGLLELLTASSAVQPVVVVLEDLHWADMQTREFIAYWLSGPVPPVALVEQADLIAFRHVLAAEAVCENLSGPRRRVLHRRAAGAPRRMSPAPLGQIDCLPPQACR